VEYDMWGPLAHINKTTLKTILKWSMGVIYPVILEFGGVVIEFCKEGLLKLGHNSKGKTDFHKILFNQWPESRIIQKS